MRFTPRRRFVVAFVVSAPAVFFLGGWIGKLCFGLALYARGSYPPCGDGVLDLSTRFAGCGDSFSPTLAVAELAGMLAVSLLAIWGLSYWVVLPIRQMADTVSGLGPTSLGVRLNAVGPRDETRQLAESIDAMLDRVAEGYDAQRRFAANASHELRTPLATQRALIEVSLADALTPDQLELLSRQLLATNARNEALIEGLLVLAETERGLMANSAQRLDLIAAAIVETLRPTAQLQGIRVEADLAPVSVAGEVPLLERLISNLVQNAIKYNVPDGWVRVRTAGPGALSVSNSGPHVPPEQVAGLFEPFRRARGDRLDHGGGVGLGLTIARSVVSAHHGTINARSNPDGGLTVEVRFPGV